MGPSGAGIWSAPTFDPSTQRVYPTTGDNYSDPPTESSDAFLAVNAGSGELAWARQITSGDAFNVACPEGENCPKAKGPDFDFGSSAILAGLPNGKRILVAGQKSGVVTAIDPDQGGQLSGRRESAMAARWAVWNGASRPIKAMCMSPCPTFE